MNGITLVKMMTLSSAWTLAFFASLQLAVIDSAIMPDEGATMSSTPVLSVVGSLLKDVQFLDFGEKS